MCGGMVSPRAFDGLQIDDELEFHGLLHGEVGWLGAFQNAYRHSWRRAETVRKLGP